MSLLSRIFGGDRGSDCSNGSCTDSSAALFRDSFDSGMARGGCGPAGCDYNYSCTDCCQPYYGGRNPGFGFGRGGSMLPMLLSGAFNPYGGFGGYGGGFGRGLLGGMLGGVIGNLISRVISRFGGGGCDQGGCDGGGGYDDGQFDDYSDQSYSDQAYRRRRDRQYQDEMSDRDAYFRNRDDQYNRQYQDQNRNYDQRYRQPESTASLDQSRPYSIAPSQREDLRSSVPDLSQEIGRLGSNDLNLVNSRRRNQGLEPLTFDPRLKMVASLQTQLRLQA